MKAVAKIVNEKLEKNKELGTFALEILLNICAVIKKMDVKEEYYKILVK